MNGKQLKNSILQWAIQGKLVPQDPNDEPASVLLQHIQEEKARLIKEGKIKKDKNDSIIYRADDNSYYEKFTATGEEKCIDEEIPFEIPNTWEWVRLGALFMHNNGKQLNKSNINGTMMDYITTSNLYWDGFALDLLKQMPFEEKEIARCQAIKGDLLVCEGGDVGRACIWTNEKPIMLQNHIHKLRAYSHLCTKFYYFVFYLYNLTGVIGGKGIGIQGFSSKALHNMLIPLPPLAEQQRIVDKIEELFPFVETYHTAQTQLDTLNANIRDLLKKSILQEAIQGKLVPQNEDEGTAEELLEQIKQEKERLVLEGKLKRKDIVDTTIFRGDDNKYYEKGGNNLTCIDNEIPFEIPNTWEWVRIKQVFFTTSGGTPLTGHPEYFQHGTIPWVKSGELTPKYLFDAETYITEEALAHSSAKYFPINTVAVAMYGATIGKTSIFKKQMTTNQAICGIFPNRYIVPEYVYYFIQAKSSDYLSMAFGSGQPNISQNKIKETLLPIPPLAEQQRIVVKIEQALASIMSR